MVRESAYDGGRDTHRLELLLVVGSRFRTVVGDEDGLLAYFSVNATPFGRGSEMFQAMGNTFTS